MFFYVYIYLVVPLLFTINQERHPELKMKALFKIRYK